MRKIGVTQLSIKAEDETRERLSKSVPAVTAPQRAKLAALLREKGIRVPINHSPSNPHLRGRTVYGVPVVLDPLMKYGEVRLK